MSRRYRFSGVPSTGPFALQVTQHGQTALGERGSWIDDDDRWGDPTPGCTATIRVKRSGLKLAPEAMLFEVDLTGFDTAKPSDPDAYDPQWHDIYYFWDFGDPGSRFTAPERVMEHQRNANVGYGPAVGHVYEKPGAYTVRVKAIEVIGDQVKVAEGTLALDGAEAVGNADDVFVGKRTIYVHPDAETDPASVFARAPKGAQIVATPSEAVNDPDNTVDTLRVILSAGSAFTQDLLMLQPGNAIRRFEGETGGPRPILTRGENGSRTQIELRNGETTFYPDWEMSVHNISFRAGWDDTTESRSSSGVGAISLWGRRPAYVLIHNCDMSGGGIGIYSVADGGTFEAETDGVLLAMSNTSIESWRSYGILRNDFGKALYLGLRITRSQDAMNGGPKNGEHNDHGPIRDDRVKYSVADGCDLFSNAGWVENVPGYRTHQTCWRTAQFGARGARYNLQRCSLEGGFQVLELDKRNSSVAGDILNALVERCLLTGSFMTRQLINGAKGGVTIRNNQGTIPGVHRLSGVFDPRYFIAFNWDPAPIGDYGENATTPIKIYNNSFRCLIADEEIANSSRMAYTVLDTSSEFINVTEINNVNYWPNLGTPLDADGPFNLIIPFAPRYDGHQSRWDRYDFVVSNLANGASASIPYKSGRQADDYNTSEYRDFAISYGVSEITLTNTSGETVDGSKHIVLFGTPSPKDTSVATDLNAIALMIPAPGASVLGAATDGPPIIGDFFGKFRPAYPSKGAFEAAP